MSSCPALKKIPDADVGKTFRGRYKYILVKVTDQNDSANQSKHVVRAGREFEYHGKSLFATIACAVFISHGYGFINRTSKY